MRPVYRLFILTAHYRHYSDIEHRTWGVYLAWRLR